MVFEHVRAGLPDAFDDLDDTDPAVLSAVARIRRECTEAKEALSADTEVSIPVLLPAARGSVRLHRSEFEEMIRPQVEETVEALRRAVDSAGLAPEQLSAVLLVGGSSRIPLVAQLVSEQLGRPVAVDADPKNAIAKGAALAVSPKPSVTWPEAAIPPVRRAGGRRRRGDRPGRPAPAGAGGRAGGRRRWPPLGWPRRPGRPPLPGARPPGRPPGPAAQLGAARHPTALPSPASGGPASRSSRPAGGRRAPPARRRPGPRVGRHAVLRRRRPAPTSPGPGHQDREDAARAGTGRGRPLGRPGAGPPALGLYVGAAGLAAVALIVVVMLWWPDYRPGSA